MFHQQDSHLSYSTSTTSRNVDILYKDTPYDFRYRYFEIDVLEITKCIMW